LLFKEKKIDIINKLYHKKYPLQEEKRKEKRRRRRGRDLFDFGIFGEGELRGVAHSDFELSRRPQHHPLLYLPNTIDTLRDGIYISLLHLARGRRRRE